MKVYADRSNLTRLRISAHRLEIEVGRWRKIPRAERTCLWCSSTLSTHTTENESHFINDCGLYETSRLNVHQKIRKLIKFNEYPSTITIDHILQLTNPDCGLIQHIERESQCHLARIIGRYITQCLNTRSDFTKTAKLNPT